MALHKKIADYVSSGKWLFGLLVGILVAIFAVLYAGQRQNAEKIVMANKEIAITNKEITGEVNELRMQIIKEFSQLNNTVSKIEERQRLRLKLDNNGK